MNIAFDATALFAECSYGRGIGHFGKRVLDGIIKRLRTDDKLYLVSHRKSELLEELYPKIDKRIIYLGDNVSVDDYAFAHDKFNEFGALAFEFFLKTYDIDIYFSPWHNGLCMRWLGQIRDRCPETKFITVVHDLIPYVFPDVYFADKTIKKLNDRCKDDLHYFDRIIANSQASKDDIIKYAFIPQKRISVVYEDSAVQTLINEPTNSNLSSLGITKDYILYVGGDEWRKNIDGLIEAFAYCNANIKKRYQLVVACKLHKPDFYRAIIKKHNLSDSVVLTGFVPDDMLHALYKNAHLFVFPSLYEGFGLPVLEAMKYGIPVITGDNSSMPELIGENGIYFKANKTKDIASAITKVIEDEGLRKRLADNSKERARLFSWDKCCDEIFAIILSAQKEKAKKQGSLKNRRLRIAYLSPLNPEQSGISDYSEDLIPDLAKYVDMDIFTASVDIDNSFIKENFDIFSYEDFEKLHSDYDMIVYQMGNSKFHIEILKYCRKYPGIVVMHDYNLRIFFDYYGNWMPNSPVGSDFILENFILQYGKRDGEKLFFTTRGNLMNAYHVEFNRYAVANALGVIVHSDFAKDRILAYSPSLPVKKIYQAVPCYDQDISENDKKKLRTKLGIADNDIVAATFGNIIPEKRIKEILHAVGKFVSSHKDGQRFKLVIAGWTWDGFKEVFQEADAKYNIKNNVILMGRVEGREFIDVMHLCDFAFNLRFPTNGETSGCLSRLLAIGKPVIVSDIDAFSEYRDDMVFKVHSGCDSEVDEIYNAICRLVGEPTLRAILSDNARKFMRENCSLEKVSAEYASFIQKAYKLKKEFYQPISSSVVANMTDEYMRLFKNVKNINLFCDALFRFSRTPSVENAETILKDINCSAVIKNILGD